MDPFADEEDPFADDGALAALEAAEAAFAGEAAGAAPMAAAAGARGRRRVDEGRFVEALKLGWGYEGFRAGQLDAIRAVVEGRDVAVYWSTGAGKSLVYQVPALVLEADRALVVVVSPLVSLMEDQVKAVNLARGAEVACFLGSAQRDGTVEDRARRGDFALVYCTPEKVGSGSSIVADLARLEHEGVPRLALIAVDEAHCVSEWGSDFRPEYARLGEVLRGPTTSAALKATPIVALTASATATVRRDVQGSLKLRETVFVSAKSVDRANLVLGVRRKAPDGGVAKHLQALVDRLRDETTKKKPVAPMIVYCATRSDVEKVAATLGAASPVLVAAYHAGLTLDERRAAHAGFLSGRVRIVVATVAFGMGIDKPDVRHVVHYSPPKTMEEYVQQVGRAGRDGLPATCTLLFSDADFARYESDFYNKGLSSENAKRAAAESRKALRAYAEDRATCRRQAIRAYFGEGRKTDVVVPIAGDDDGGNNNNNIDEPRVASCRCDVCVARAAGGGTASDRDYLDVARLVLMAAQAKPLLMSGLVDAATCAKTTALTERIRPRLQAARLGKNKQLLQSKDRLKAIVPLLVEKGLLARMSRKGEYRAYEVYQTTSAGARAMQGRELFLAPPAWLLEQEAEERARAATRIAELVEAGIDLGAIPAEEVERGTGPTLSAELDWVRRLKRWRDDGHGGKAAKYEALLASLAAWRDAEAQRHEVAPSSIVADHVLKKIAYALPTTADALRDIGLRFEAGAAALAALIDARAADLGITQSSASSQDQEGGPLPLPRGPFTPPGKWTFALDASGPTAKKPKSWELSYARFAEGESCAAIAMSQPNGKPIQPGTVVMHILKALVHGDAVDLRRLDADGKGARPRPCGAPSMARWARLEDAEARCDGGGSIVVGAEKYDLNALYEALGGDVADAARIDYSDRSEDQIATLSSWRSDVTWWEALKRAGFVVPPQGGADSAQPPLAKKPRTTS